MAYSSKVKYEALRTIRSGASQREAAHSSVDDERCLRVSKGGADK